MNKKKQKQKKKIKDEVKVVRWLKFVVALCIIILVCEGIFIGIKAYQKQNGIIYIDTFAAARKLEDGYIGVGSSDFKYSKLNDYSKEYEKAKIVKYDSNHKVIFETAYTKGYNSYFNDVEIIDDGYIAVGASQYSKEQLEGNTTDGLIAIYDQTGKQIKTKTLQIVGDTTFTKIKVLEDGYLVIGQSILENMVIGSDPNGGGIMIKYNKDLEEVWRTNYGGSKSGIFNDVVVEDDAIYVVGKDATRYGVFIKYDKDGNRQFVKNYEYTDTIGFSAITKMNDDYVVVGSKTMNIDAEDQDKKTQALVVKYDKDGNILFEKTYEKNKNARFNNVIVDNNEIIAIGHTAKKDEEESTDTYNMFRYSGLFAKYSESGDVILEQEEKGSRDTYFSQLLKVDDQYVVIGQTSSKELGGNNKDLKGYFLYYDKNGKRVSYSS